MHSVLNHGGSNEDERYEEVSALLKASKRTTALTGAGVSVGSGIPPFRGKGGVWSKYDPDEFGHIESFRKNPERVWGMLREFLSTCIQAEPNPSHIAMAELEKKGFLHRIITQNVDGLHQKAGSKKVIEFHGTIRRLRCDECMERYAVEDVDINIPVPSCRVEGCRGPLRPDWVFFGEPISTYALEGAKAAAAGSSVLLVVGTSAVVMPAANVIHWARASGAAIVEINLEPTHLTEVISDYFLQGPAEVVLPRLVERLEKNL